MQALGDPPAAAQLGERASAAQAVTGDVDILSALNCLCVTRRMSRTSRSGGVSEGPGFGFGFGFGFYFRSPSVARSPKPSIPQAVKPSHGC
jgi:hypothetical protein